MNTFNWVKGLGFGIILWAIMLIIAFAVGWVGFEATLLVNVAIALVTAVIAYLLARNVRPSTLGQAAGYGLLWAVVGFVLDFGILHNFDTSILASWQYWMLFAGAFVGPVVHGLEVDVRQDSPRFGVYQ
jgi:hypothetical protein